LPMTINEVRYEAIHHRGMCGSRAMEHERDGR
jgi:hypothetical protein